MAIWKEQTSTNKEAAPMWPDRSAARDTEARVESAQTFDTPRRTSERDIKESLIAAGLTIEGKIEEWGTFALPAISRATFTFKAISRSSRARGFGGVRASTVVIGGELEGNIDAASRVELLDTGVLNGNLKAGSLTVAAGSRMRGQAEFGWDERTALAPDLRVETELAS